MTRALASVALAAFLLAGCASDPPLSGPATTEEPVAEEGRTSLRPETSNYEGTWTAGVYAAGGPPLTLLGTAPLTETLHGDETGWLLEMSWTASSPASETMGLDVFVDGESVATATGPSPLRLTMPAPKAGEYTANARATGPMDAGGAFVDQSYVVRTAAFRGMPFDAAFVFEA